MKEEDDVKKTQENNRNRGVIQEYGRGQDHPKEYRLMTRGTERVTIQDLRGSRATDVMSRDLLLLIDTIRIEEDPDRHRIKLVITTEGESSKVIGLDIAKDNSRQSITNNSMMG